MSDENFDIPAILKQGSLDIHRVIRINLALQVGEYFNMLSNCCEQAPKAIEAFGKIVSQEAVETDYDALETFNTLLESLGSVKFVHELEDIIKSGWNRGHKEYAADLAKKIVDEFNGFCAQIIKTKITGETGIDKTQRLKDYLILLEKGDAANKLQILAVDDAPVMLRTISSLLSEKYKVHILPDPTRVEKFLHQITPDLFLLDYQMPVLNGFELIPIIRKFWEHKNTPIIFLTSEGTPDHVAEALSRGACDFIVKPFQPNLLLEKVAKHIGRRH
ncbi:MAG: response regulator [Treponema sp.]|jgi:PleD family two-component response regulator|nr:response regulator [Treponema sp.]